MSESRKLRPLTIEGPWRFVPVEEWAERHRRAGHHPQPTPTIENPEKWNCDCGALWRILTLEQIRQKFAHLGRIAEASKKGIPLPWEKDPAWAEDVRRAKAKHAHERAQYSATGGRRHVGS